MCLLRNSKCVCNHIPSFLTWTEQGERTCVCTTSAYLGKRMHYINQSGNACAVLRLFFGGGEAGAVRQPEWKYLRSTSTSFRDADAVHLSKMGMLCSTPTCSGDAGAVHQPVRGDEAGRPQQMGSHRNSLGLWPPLLHRGMAGARLLPSRAQIDMPWHFRRSNYVPCSTFCPSVRR